VSQVVPTIHPTIKICDDSVTLHTEEFKEAAKSEIGDEALINGAMLLARIAIRLLTDESYLNQVKSEFQAIKSMNEESVG
ncbi:MAG: amidohydrolase, partial [Turicibacter sp.]|nr:amidohydrolase [Turicibacter sp.]